MTEYKQELPFRNWLAEYSEGRRLEGYEANISGAATAVGFGRAGSDVPYVDVTLVRFANEGDLETVLKLNETYRLEEQGRREDLVNADWPTTQEARVYAAGEVGNLRVLVAEHGGSLVGYLAFKLDAVEQKTLEIDSLYVSPESRRKEIGKALVERVETIARGMGKTFVHVRHFNDSEATMFYQSLGFTPQFAVSVKEISKKEDAIPRG